MKNILYSTDLTDVDAIDQSKKPLLTNRISNYSSEVNGFVWQTLPIKLFGHIVLNHFKDKCRCILRYLSASNLNLISCHSCVLNV